MQLELDDRDGMALGAHSKRGRMRINQGFAVFTPHPLDTTNLLYGTITQIAQNRLFNCLQLQKISFGLAQISLTNAIKPLMEKKLVLRRAADRSGQAYANAFSWPRVLRDQQLESKCHIGDGDDIVMAQIGQPARRCREQRVEAAAGLRGRQAGWDRRGGAWVTTRSSRWNLTGIP